MLTCHSNPGLLLGVLLNKICCPTKNIYRLHRHLPGAGQLPLLPNKIHQSSHTSSTAQFLLSHHTPCLSSSPLWAAHHIHVQSGRATASHTCRETNRPLQSCCKIRPRAAQVELRHQKTQISIRVTTLSVYWTQEKKPGESPWRGQPMFYPRALSLSKKENNQKSA